MARIRWGTTRTWDSFPHHVAATHNRATVVEAWCQNNCKSDYMFVGVNSNMAFAFDDGKEAMMFKLVWG